uniref:FecR family protein n=1 Tax=Pedobacter schmidteae TaxID=2201271 RepID=UPI000EABB2EC|nr:FecR family protein [Pedobacter schmidteae]
MMDKNQIKPLIAKYLEGSASAEEAAVVETWYNTYQEGADPELTDVTIAEATLRIQDRLNIEQQVTKTSLWPRIAAAAAIVLVVGAGVFYFQSNNKAKTEQVVVNAVKDISSGKQGATLTLANGKKIVLSGASKGEIASEAGVSISMAQGGQLIYEIKDQAKRDRYAINTLSTARGETYQVHLPDGTLVWLNAGSTLKYPASFNASKERNIELTGEAYFEVAKDKMHPFKVKSPGQEIEVLGTHFNMNAYADEASVKTTLLEGSVKVLSGSSSTIIEPGQQASSKGQKISVDEVNVNTVIDWKNGLFRFKNEALPSILRKVARWYDVEISYQLDVKNMPTFSGAVARTENVSAILKMLEETSDVKFSIEGKTIIVR